MNRALATILIPVMVALPLFGCSSTYPPGIPSQGDIQQGSVVEGALEDAVGANFRLLISDEPNAIGDFAELWVTISTIGFVPAGNDGEDRTLTLDPVISVNLVELLDENAVALWEGYLPAGEYSRVFLHVDEVTGRLLDTNEALVKLPSGMLQLDMRFTVGEPTEGELTNFVYDIAVIRAGNSGQYILKPQASQSGVSQQFRLLKHTRDRIQQGPHAWAHRPEWAGRPDWAGDDSDNQGNATNQWAARPEWAGGRPAVWVPDDDQSELKLD